MKKIFLSIALLIITTIDVLSQQVPDSAFQFRPVSKMYTSNNGPTIYVDEAHNNFHTLSTRYFTFGEVLKNDGYNVKPFKEKFSEKSLQGIRILVIANALPDSGGWQLPARTAFTNEEATALKSWVEQGGSLFLIADHMPCPGAAYPIGKAFGINLYNGFAMYQKDGPETFTRASGTLKSNPITNGRNSAERVDSITIFTGHAFLPLRPCNSIVELTDDHKVYFPKVAGEFNEQTPFIDASGLFHSVYFTEKKGRVVIAAEAAMFSAQLAGPGKNPMGMNEPGAKHNPQLLLNIIHWLDGKLK